MPRSALRTNLYPWLKLVPTILASISAITTASLKADPKTTTAQLGPSVGAVLAILQANSWLILFISACTIVLLNLILRWIGEPWRWNAIQVVLDRLRDNVYKQEFQGEPYHYLITQLAPREARQGRRVVHRYQSCHGTSRDPVSERPLPIRVPAALRHRGTMRGSSGENSLA